MVRGRDADAGHVRSGTPGHREPITASPSTEPVRRAAGEESQQPDTAEPTPVPSGSVQIRFVDAEGNPVADITAEVRERVSLWAGESEPRTVQADATGLAWYLPDERSQEIEVVVVGDQWVSRGGWVDPRQEVPVIVQCRPVTRHVWGYVRDLEGVGLAGAFVECHGRTAMTRADGAYDLWVGAPYDRDIEARRDGYAPASVLLGPLAATPVRLDFQIQPCRRIRGRIVRAIDGQPLGGAVIGAAGGYTRAVSDAKGRFEVQLHTENNLVIVHHSEFPTAQFDLTPYVEAATDARIEMASGVDLEVHVLSRSGQPIAGAAGGVFCGLDEQRARTDAAGRVAFTRPAAGRVSCSASAPGFVPAVVEVGAVREGPVSVVLEPAGVLHGRVVSTLGPGLPGAILYRMRTDPQGDVLGPLGRWVRCGEGGSFSIPDAADTTAVEVQCKGYQRKLFPSLSRHAGPVELRLEPVGHLEGLVVDRVTGAPVNRFTIRFFYGSLQSGELPLSRARSEWFEAGVHFVQTQGRWIVDEDYLVVGQVTGVAITAEGYLEAKFPRVIVGVQGRPPEVFALQPR